MRHFKLIIAGLLILGTTAFAAGKLQNSDFASSTDITGAGGSVSQLLNTSKIYDNVNAQVLNTTIAAKATNPMTTAEDLIKGGVSGAPARLAVGSNGQCLTVSGGVVGWGTCGTSSPLTTKGDIYTYDTGNARLPVGTDGQILSANSAQATGLEWIAAPSGGDASTNTATSVDSEIALFSGTTGKLLKRATGTGVCKSTSGVFSVGTVSLTSEISGILPMVNGGTNKNMTAVNGGVVWTDADSQEVIAAGTSGQFLQSNGAAAPSWAAAPNPSAVVKAVNQTTHGFAVQDVIYYTGSAWAKAKADADSTSEAIGMVSAVADADNFTVTFSGEITGLSGLTSGTTYYLSSATSGLATATEPTAAGHISKPVGVALSTTVMRLFDSSRGAVIGGASATNALFASVKWPGTASCTWTRTSNATFADFSADTDCTTPAGGNIVGTGISAPGTKVPGFVIDSADTTSGVYYKVTVTGNMAEIGSLSSPCATRLSNGTDVSNVVPIWGSNTGNGNNATAVFFIPISTPGSSTVQLQMTGVSTNNQCDIITTVSGFNDLTFFVEKVSSGAI